MTIPAACFTTIASLCCYEPVSSFTHLVGTVWFAVLGKFLLKKAEGNRGHQAALCVYAVSCVVLLTCSALYHWLPPGAERTLMRQLDMAAIFFLIAGTFTPLCTILYRGAARWVSLAMIWSIALVGMGIRLCSIDAFPERFAVGIYLSFGWLGAIFAVELWRRYSFAFVRPLFVGGMAYTLGTLVLAWEMPPRLALFAGPHDLWHVAVLIGIGFHWRFTSQIAELSGGTEWISARGEVAPGLAQPYYSAKS